MKLRTLSALWGEPSVEEHKKIIAALQGIDFDAAAERLEENWQKSLQPQLSRLENIQNGT